MSRLIKVLFELIKIMDFTQLLKIKNKLFHPFEISDSEFTAFIETHVDKEKKKCCPYCKKSDSVVRFGLNALKNQRFKCKDCVKYFCNSTNSPMYYSKKPMESWYNYLKLMGKTSTVRECAAELKINIATAFQWRHKILNSIMSMLPSKLEGIIEIEEIFFTESFKGNHAKDYSFDMGRPTIKRKMTPSQYLNRNKVSVLCCRDRAESIFAKAADRGKTRFVKMFELLGDKIPAESTLCTNNNLSYISLAQKLKCKLYKMRDYREVKEGQYHIQNASRFADSIKLTINEKFRGVATKYLNFYLAWLQWLETMKNKKTEVKLMDILSMCLFANRKFRICEFRTLQALE